MAHKPVKDLKIKLFADGAERAGILKMYTNPLIRGFTTNPTLMRKAGITDYEAFAKDIISAIPDRPLSLEVFADELHKLALVGKDLDDYALETVEMFHRDAAHAGFTL